MSAWKLCAMAGVGMLFGAALAGCYDEAPPSFADIGVRWLDADNEELGAECLELPFLPGGTVDRSFDIGSGVKARIVGTSRDVEVTVDGTEPPTPRATITHDSLRLGYSALMDVRAAGGERYRIVLFGPCDPARAAALLDASLVP